MPEDAVSPRNPDSEVPEVFALVIGIDDYLAKEVYPTLSGCVNDARAFHQYLLDPREKRGLQVAASNVVLLENGQATRAAILDKFKSHFLDNPEIPDHGNATMILFYAGHGTRIEAPENRLASDEMVEAIAPVDERTDTAGNYVHAIPDYVLGWLLMELSKKKGSNITVIFDSCHSGGMGRDAGKARAGKIPSHWVPLELDSDLWKGRTDTAQSYRMWSQSATSHVLLAACHEDETALEIAFIDGSNRSIHGRFTESLIKWLRRLSLEITTYTELLNRIPSWYNQTPQCGGAMRDRLVFNGNYPATGKHAIPLMPHTSPSAEDLDILPSFIVEMGSVEGVVPGTEFAAYAPDNTFLRTLVAESVEIGHTILVTEDKKPLDIPDQARAMVSDWKNDAIIMHVYLAPDFPHTTKLFPTTNVIRQPKRRRYVRVPTPESAEIVLRHEGEEIVVQRLTSKILEYQRETRFPLYGNAVQLTEVMDGIAHFNYFLERHHGSAPIAGLSLQMHRLLGNFPGRYPDLTAGPACDGNLVANHEAKFASEVGAKYGFTLRNASADNLFAYLFFFDPVRYTISLWYSPSGPTARAPLQAGGSLTIGMGGERAFEFTLSAGESSSSGFLKLFVSNQQLKLEWIELNLSPFDPAFKGTPRLGWTHESLAHVPKWDALDVVLTMTK